MLKDFKNLTNQGVRESSKTQSWFFYGYVVVAVAFFMQLIMVGAVNAYGIVFKPMLTDFNWSRGMTSGVSSIFYIVKGSLGIAMGGFTDRFGPRIVLTLCGLMMGIGYLLLSQINDIWQAISNRDLSGDFDNDY